MMINRTLLCALVFFISAVYASESSKMQLANNLEALAAYKEGMKYLALYLKDGLEKNQHEQLIKQTLDAFAKAETLNPNLFKVNYQLGLMYLEGNGVAQNLILAEKYADKAIIAAGNGADDTKNAQDLKQRVQAAKKITLGKRIEAKDLADSGFAKLKKFENPPSDSSVEGFDKEALLLLGRSSVLDNTNFDVEYKLATMYLNGVGTRVDFDTARQYAKQALKIAQDVGNEELSAQAKKLIGLIFVKSTETSDTYGQSNTDKRKSRASSIFGGSSSDSNNDEKRKSVLDLLKRRSGSDSTSTK